MCGNTQWADSHGHNLMPHTLGNPYMASAHLFQFYIQGCAQQAAIGHR